MSVSSGVRPVGAVLGISVVPGALDDPQDALLGGLVAFMTKDTPSVQHVLDLTEPFLQTAAGLTAATVYELDSEIGLLNPTARVGPTGNRDLLTAGKVFRMAAGAAPLVDGERMAIRLRIGGQTVGVLLLTGTELAVLRPETLGPIALHFATALQGIAAEKQRQFLSHVSTIVRRLFEQGVAATSVEAAGRVLVAAAEAFRTDFGALCLVDAEGRIRYVHTVGTADGDDRLRHLIGTAATDSPVWRAICESTPALVADSAEAAVSPTGFVRTLGLKSYIAIPMMSAGGCVGMSTCGNAAETRDWTSRDRILAEQLSVEGALIVDSAGMRQAAQAHAAQLSHQAFHDSLTGLPNRSYLLERAEQAVVDAADTDGRVALMLLDLNGFKEVNDLTRDPDEDVANRAAGRIVDRLREPFTIDGEDVQIGGSVGIALYPDDADAYDDLMRGADAAMYEAKRDTKKLGGCRRRAHRETFA